MTSPHRAGRQAIVRLARTFGLCLLSLVATRAAAEDQTAQVPSSTASQARAPDLVPGTSFELDEIDVIAKALDIARGQIQPSLGATVYQLQRQTIESQTQGDNAPFNQVLLQAPGVVQDSLGQIRPWTRFASDSR